MNFKRLLKPILVILAILVLTLSVSAGDLYSTYGQRIKLTIDHTKIDADLSWFPVTVFLGNYGDAIDIGVAAIQRPNVYYPATLINKGNPANASGKITSVEIYASSNMTGAIVATFYQPDPTGYPNNLTARDSYSIGSVTSGAKRTFEVDLDVEAGDYLGVYFASGYIYYETAEGSGIWYAGYSDQTSCTNRSFGFVDVNEFSLYATGFEKSQGTEVFAEFDADEDFDRIAFTTSDGETQLYADCELFDDSEQKAIYHISKTGWTVSSSTDTDIYLYYDNTAGHNTTYVSKSGGTAAQSVWDSNFKAVYHMNDIEAAAGTEQWDDGFEDNNLTEYDTVGSDVATASDQKYTGTYSAKFASDGSTVAADTTLQRNVGTNTNYSEVEFYVRTDNSNVTGNYIVRKPGYVLRILNQKFQYYNGSSYSDLPTATSCSANMWYHVRVYVDAVNDIAMYWINGTYKGTVTDCDISAHDGIQIIGVYGETTANTWIDDLKYTTYDKPAYGIFDSTSNQNNGIKKAINEPIEATGLVGKGQDFDGSNDYIDITGVETGNSFTVEFISEYNNLVGASENVYWLDSTSGRFIFGKTLNTTAMQYYDGTAWRTGDDDIPNDSALHYVGYVLDGTTPEGKIVIDTNITSGITYSANNIGGDVKIGRRASLDGNPFDGIIDEFRISNTNRSAAWIAATNSSLRDILLTYSAEETGGGETPEEATNVLFIFSNF